MIQASSIDSSCLALKAQESGGLAIVPLGQRSPKRISVE
jgi:hypothetical protein